MKKERLVYLAGLFDGEGCIMLILTNRKEIYLIVTIGNVYLPSLLRIKEEFGGCIQKRKNKLYVWSASSRIALRFLKDIYPYLDIKKEQASIGITFGKNVRSIPKDRRIRMRKRLQELKKVRYDYDR